MLGSGELSPRPRVVIVGAGFGGLAAAQALRRAPVDVTIVDKRNHHLFQPLLYQVATAGLSPADIAAPIRAILRNHANTRVLLDRVIGVDTAARRVQLAGGDALPYDFLLLATGARHSYFGRDEWARYAPGIKSLEDATAVRRKVLIALERAETERDPERRQALLTFVVIGGGPTGVEMAGAIAELTQRSVSRDFRSITPRCSRVVLIEAGKRLLPGFPESLSMKARRAIRGLGVELRLRSTVTAISRDAVALGGEIIRTHNAIWAAGVQASPAARWLEAESDKAGRVVVGPDLRVPPYLNIFAIGDTVRCVGENGQPLPGVAPVAKQQGKYVAATIGAMLAGRAMPPFRYRNYGNLATIGRSRAVIDFGRLRLSGRLAWLIWSTAHIFFLVSFRSRIAVGLDLLWNYLTFERSARLITGEIETDLASTPTLKAA
jgi:NADH dehydrogenase